jgi:hypothetical protein
MICFKLKSLRLILLIFCDDLMLLIVDCVVYNMSIEKVSYTGHEILFKKWYVEMLCDLGLNRQYWLHHRIEMEIIMKN